MKSFLYLAFTKRLHNIGRYNFGILCISTHSLFDYSTNFKWVSHYPCMHATYNNWKTIKLSMQYNKSILKTCRYHLHCNHTSTYLLQTANKMKQWSNERMILCLVRKQHSSKMSDRCKEQNPSDQDTFLQMLHYFKDEHHGRSDN